MFASPGAARWQLALELLRAEGWRGLRARLLDRAAEARRRRSFRRLVPGEGVPASPVLNVLPTALRAELGGVQVQLRERLEQERGSRPVALLYPARGGFRLELQAASRRLVLELPGPATAEGWAAALRAARAATGARLVHVENLAGLPLRLLPALAAEPGLVISLHDLGAACLRILLGGAPDPTCSLAWGGPPCAQCPRGPATSAMPEALEARTTVATLLARAGAVVLPSEFLRARLRSTFPALSERRTELLVPARSLPSWPPRSPGPLRHAVFVGAAHPHKGAALLAELLEARPLPGVRWSALGGGPPAWQAHLRRRGVLVRGHYRDGSLPHQLRALGADLTLLLSVWPESWGLTLDESWAAGVPSLLLDVGAPAERVRALGGGHVVRLADGAAGLARALRALSHGLPAVPPPERRPDLSPERAARSVGGLYAALLD